MPHLELESQAAITPTLKKGEGRSAGGVGNLLFSLYRIRSGLARSLIQSLVERLEGGEMYSLTLRRIFTHYHQVTVGLYTHGGCFSCGYMRAGTTIGRYCSIAMGVSAINNHLMNMKSSHALFFNPELGYVKEEPIHRTPLVIGNDVMIGKNAIILPSVSSIGHGAVIGAGSVLNKNIPPYAVVVGNPSQLVRYRFSKETIHELMESRWWDRSIEELAADLASFQQPLEGKQVR